MMRINAVILKVKFTEAVYLTADFLALIIEPH